MGLLAVKEFEVAKKEVSTYGTKEYQSRLTSEQEKEIVTRIPEIAKAIKVAEGDPTGFGVRSVPVESTAEAEKVLNNSIYNNYVRWTEAGKPGKFIDHMQKRWAPVGAENDPENLNVNWTPNVRKSLEGSLNKEEYKQYKDLNLVDLNPFRIREAEATELTPVKMPTAAPNLIAIKPEELGVSAMGGAGGGWREYKKIPLPSKWFERSNESLMNTAMESMMASSDNPEEVRREFEETSRRGGDIGRVIDRTVINALNSRFFGLPLYGLKKAGFTFEDPESTSEIVAGAVGDLTGFISGPAKVGQALARRIPIAGRVFNLATTKAQSIIKPILRSALSLGTSFGLMTPEEGLLAPEARLRQFGSGATMGTAFGVLGFIPSTPLRSLITSAYIGVPATLREEPLEMQIFSYGLGAYYGWKGKIDPNKLLAQEGKLAKYIRHGVDVPEAMLLLDRADRDLKTLKSTAKAYGPEPEPLKWRFNRILKQHGVGHYDPMRDIISKESFAIASREVEGIKAPSTIPVKKIKGFRGKVRKFVGEKIPTQKPQKDYYTPARIPERGKDYVYAVRLKDGTTLKGLSKDASHADVLNRYRKQADKGLIKQFGVVDLRTGKMMTGDSEINFRGRPIRDVLTKKDKVKIKENAIKKWREAEVKDLHRQIYDLTHDRATGKMKPEFELRNDDIRFIISQIGTSKKALEGLSNTDLYNMRQTIAASQKPPVDIFETRPPTVRGFIHQSLINVWDVTLRPGYKLLQKMGYGDIMGTGLTNQYARAEVNERNFIFKYVELSNNWKRTVGMNKETAMRIYDWWDGNLHKNHLSPKEYMVGKQIRAYSDFCLDIQNRHRAVYGQEPIKPVTNYATHIFDHTLWVNPDTGVSVSRKEFLSRKYPFPEHLESILKWTTPKEKQSPFLKKRTGGLHYVRDVWRALDTYTRAVAQMVNDDPVRRSHSIANFLKREMELNKKTGKKTFVDLGKIEAQTRRFAQDYVGRPGWMDAYIKNSVEGINRFLPEKMKIRSIVSLSNAATTLLYGTQMSYRLKTAIRNYGQHGLIIGRTGFKPVGWAISVPKNKPFIAADGKTYTPNEILKNSLVLQSRPGAYAPEIEAIGPGSIVSKGMVPFKKVDYLNVRDAYLAGWKFKMDSSKFATEAYKYADQTAALTQFVYLRGNRSMLARGGGVSKIMGRPMSVFTTWPANYMEFLIASSAPEHRVNLVKYLAYSVAMTAALSAAGIKGLEYTGLGSPMSLWKVYTGELPLTGILGRPSIQAVRDIMKGMDKGIKDMLFYTYNKEEVE